VLGHVILPLTKKSLSLVKEASLDPDDAPESEAGADEADDGVIYIADDDRLLKEHMDSQPEQREPGISCF